MTYLAIVDLARRYNTGKISKEEFADGVLLALAKAGKIELAE